MSSFFVISCSVTTKNIDPFGVQGVYIPGVGGGGIISRPSGSFSMEEGKNEERKGGKKGKMQVKERYNG